MAYRESFGGLCSRLGVEFCCPHCKSGSVIKSGKNSTGKQRYSCKQCHKRFITDYNYKAYKQDINQKIIQFTKEGLGIRSTARILAISVTTLLKRIMQIASGIKQPILQQNREYEVDEMRIFIGSKRQLCWIVYALDRWNKKVVAFNAGKRTNSTLNVALRSLLFAKAKTIYTDKLRNYRFLIHKKIHRTTLHCTNHIERHNLTLRTHLKRLTRKTICFSRSVAMLFAVLRIYFWG